MAKWWEHMGKYRNMMGTHGKIYGKYMGKSREND
jgi:hypothetical protein